MSSQQRIAKLIPALLAVIVLLAAVYLWIHRETIILDNIEPGPIVSEEEPEVVSNTDDLGSATTSPAISVFAQNLTIPWGMVFLPDGDMLVTERTGSLRRLGKDNTTIDIPDVRHFGEGGLMGIAIHPDFESNRFLYLYFTVDDDGSENRVVRYRFQNSILEEDKIILDNIPGAIYHDGGQIAFGPDGMLYITVGDATKAQTAQDLDALSGKTLRLTRDGEIPDDNPFGTAVWSYGHRNAQGLAWDHLGQLWQTEHGRSGLSSGYDELNKIEKGGNYGWPEIQGDETQEGMIAPVIQSGPQTTWAPGAIVFHNQRLYFTGLRGARLYEVVLNDEGDVTARNEYLVNEYGRLRGIIVGPDGYLYISTSNRDGRGDVNDGDDKILKVDPEQL